MLDALADLLRDEPSDDLGSGPIIGRLMEVIRAASHSSCAFVHETVQFGRRLYFAEVESMGTAGFRAATAGLEGRSLFEYVCPADHGADEAWPGDLNPVDRFGLTHRAAVRPLGAWGMYWQPGRIRSTLGMTVVHDGVLLGGVVCARRLDEQGFTRGDIGALRPLEDGVRRWFAAAWRRRQAACRAPGSQSYLIFDADGGLVSTSRGAAPWLRTSAMVDHLRRLALRVVRGEADGRSMFVRRAPVRFERLAGDHDRVLAIVEEGEHHRPGPREKLTDAQRRVADLAVAGATVKEIAADLQRSPETVRDHLKAIYDRLGIGSRVELGRVLDPPPPLALRSNDRALGAPGR